MGPTAQAQADPGVTAAQNLLEQATKPQRDGSHNALLLGLRELEDPALLPLMRGLSNSPYLSMRIHGQLGTASLSPKRQINVSALAEVEDQAELVQVLSAAIDDELIDKQAMATLLTWDGLELPLRQAVALRLLGVGGEVDVKPFRESLAIEINDETTAAKLLQYALASMLFAESGSSAGKAALNNLATLQANNIDAVLGQVLDAAMRQDFTSAGSLALTIAKDRERTSSLKLLAIQTALRLKTPGGPEQWKAMFRNEEGSAARIRLAMIALDGAEQLEPNFFDSFAEEGAWIAAIGKAGRAIASKSENLADAFAPLIQTGQPISLQWIVTYCQRSKTAQGPALLEQIILNHAKAPKHHRGRIIQVAIAATTTYCELYPKGANVRLAQLLDVNQTRPTGPGDDSIYLTRRQIMLMGAARAKGVDLKALAQTLETDDLNDFTTEALRLFVRARHDATLNKDEWSEVSDIVQGVGNFQLALRMQLGWMYLKHKSLADKSVAKVLR